MKSLKAKLLIGITAAAMSLALAAPSWAQPRLRGLVQAQGAKMGHPGFGRQVQPRGRLYAQPRFRGFGGQDGFRQGRRCRRVRFCRPYRVRSMRCSPRTHCFTRQVCRRFQRGDGAVVTRCRPERFCQHRRVCHPVYHQGRRCFFRIICR